MIFGVGTDIMDVARVEKELNKETGLKEKLFTSFEITYCESKAHPYQHFASRFSAKESFLKALGTGWRDGIQFIDIEIVNNRMGKPLIRLHGKARELSEKLKFKNIQLSISHLEKFVSTIVIIET